MNSRCEKRIHIQETTTKCRYSHSAKVCEVRFLLASEMAPTKAQFDDTFPSGRRNLAISMVENFHFTKTFAWWLQNGNSKPRWPISIQQELPSTNAGLQVLKWNPQIPARPRGKNRNRGQSGCVIDRWIPVVYGFFRPRKKREPGNAAMLG